MLPIPTLWWFLPVRSAARVGEQSAVVWNWLYRNPLAATRSSAGVGIGPPNVLAAPKPVSSVMIKSTFGAPLGALTSLGKSGLDSLALRPMTPPKGASGTGRIGEPPVGDFSAGLSWANTLTGSPLAASQPTTAPVMNTITAVGVVAVRMASPPREMHSDRQEAEENGSSRASAEILTQRRGIVHRREVGGGFSASTLASVFAQLKPLVQAPCPFQTKPKTKEPA